MENLSNDICVGCLRTDRKTKHLSNVMKKQIFHQLIWEITSSHAVDDVSLCWECEALITRFTKFKLLVQRSFRILKNFEQITQLELPSRFTIQNLFSINYVPNETQEDFTPEYKFDIIKTEDTDDIKLELLDKEFIEKPLDSPERIDDGNSDSDDDKLLIELSQKEKDGPVKKNRVKKEKNEEYTEQEFEIQYYKEIYLTIEEVEEERRSQELKEDYVNALFRCEKCIISFPNVHDLNDHYNIKHELNASSYKCGICECAFASEVAYNYHAHKHRLRYQCSVCEARLPSKRGAVKHYEFVHCTRTDLEYGLNNGNVKKSLNSDIGINYSINGKRETFACDSCNKVFKWKTSLRKHAETHRIEAGQKRRPHCDVCSLGFTSTSNLQKHVKTSSKHQIQLKLRKLKETLPQEASTPEKEEAHIQEIKSSINKGRQLYPCEQCDRKFQWRGNLLRHLHSHAARAKGELVCVPCNRTFSSIATYKQHMKISKKHVSENDFDYVCNECGKKFANKTRLKDHVDWEHLKNFVHKCAQCQKVFKSHTSLYLHKQVVHKKDNAQHLCDHCGKPFPNRTKLRGHIIALHTVEAPYACSACSARFSWHSCLSRHVRRVHQRQGKQKQNGTQN